MIAKKKKGKEKASTCFFSKTRDLRFHENTELSVVRETRTITYADIRISTLWNRGN